MADPAMQIDELPIEECDELLASHHFGRIAMVIDGSPEIRPVNYIYNDGRVAFRTDTGSILASIMGSVAFEIDNAEPATRTGWSVLVKGRGYDITDSIDEVSVDLRRFPVDTWAPGSKTSWIRIEPDSITGRRIRPA